MSGRADRKPPDVVPTLAMRSHFRKNRTTGQGFFSGIPKVFGGTIDYMEDVDQLKVELTATSRRRLSDAIEASGRAQGELALAAGFSGPTLSGWLSGHGQDTIRETPALCEQLGIPLYYALPLSDEQVALLDALEVIRGLEQDGDREAARVVRDIRLRAKGLIAEHRDDSDAANLPLLDPARPPAK